MLRFSDRKNVCFFMALFLDKLTKRYDKGACREMRIFPLPFDKTKGISSSVDETFTPTEISLCRSFPIVGVANEIFYGCFYFLDNKNKEFLFGGLPTKGKQCLLVNKNDF